MTTTEQTNALATRELTDTQIKARMELNKQARFGLQEASPAQLNIVFLLSKRWGLDPVNELTLFEGRPFITLEGRQQLMRRHPDYHTFRTRPLSKQEREDWGYELDDIVVECTIVTREHGDIVARGAVRRSEIDGARATAQERGRRSAPVGMFGPEIAEARALKRATRAAFGQDIPDESDLEGFDVSQVNPARVALNAARYDELMGKDEDGTQYYDLPETRPADSHQPGARPLAEERPPVASAVPAGTDAPVMVTRVRHPLNAELAELLETAAQLDIDIAPYRVSLPSPVTIFDAQIEALKAAILAKESADADQAEFAL